MQLQSLAAAAALALLVACDKAPEPGAAAPAQSNASGGSSTPGTPANLGQPGPQEQKEGANPQQGQVDPKQPQQHKDFQQRGDEKGPSSPDTQPKAGG